MVGRERKFFIVYRQKHFLLFFYLTEKHQICILYQETFFKKKFIDGFLYDGNNGR